MMPALSFFIASEPPELALDLSQGGVEGAEENWPLMTSQLLERKSQRVSEELLKAVTQLLDGIHTNHKSLVV